MEQDRWKNIDNQAKEILALLEKGLSQTEIHEITGLSIENWQHNKKHCPKFAEGVEMLVNRHVGMLRKSLWKIALGYEYDETVVTERTLPDGTVEKTRTVTTKHVPPHYDACREIMRIIDKETPKTTVSPINSPYKENVGRTMKHMVYPQKKPKGR